MEKTNDPILGKLSDGKTDRWTDGRTDESDFKGRCPANLEHPKSFVSNNTVFSDKN